MSRAIRAERSQLMLLPPSLDDFVAVDDPVRLVADFVAALDLGALGFSDPDPALAGAPAYGAEMLLSVWLYGYMRRIRSTRQLEIACRERTPVMWLTGMKYPDHNTLWRFFREHRVAIRKVFAKLVTLAADAGLVGMTLHALDGTKIPAASSTEKALHRDSLRERLMEVERAIMQIEEQVIAIEREQGETRLPAELTSAKERRSLIEAQLKKLDAAGVDHLHEQEPDARAMQSRGNGTKLSYNAQATADENGFVVGESVSNDAIDFSNLSPMLDQVAQTLAERPERTAVDGGYVSAESLAKAQDARHALVVPDGALRNAEADPSNPFDKVHFEYDRERDVYVCPLGEVLPLERLMRDKKHYSEKAVYRCKKRDCPRRAECTKDSKGRSVKRAVHDAALERQREIQRDPDVNDLYRHRKTLIEPIFALVKWVDGFRRFTMRGFDSVRAQWSLVCAAINLRKLIPHWRAGHILAPSNQDGG